MNDNCVEFRSERGQWDDETAKIPSNIGAVPANSTANHYGTQRLYRSASLLPAIRTPPNSVNTDGGGFVATYED